MKDQAPIWVTEGAELPQSNDLLGCDAEKRSKTDICSLQIITPYRRVRLAHRCLCSIWSQTQGFPKMSGGWEVPQIKCMHLKKAMGRSRPLRMVLGDCEAEFHEVQQKSRYASPTSTPWASTNHSSSTLRQSIIGQTAASLEHSCRQTTLVYDAQSPQLPTEQMLANEANSTRPSINYQSPDK